MPQRPLDALALDFDGVVCDALNECAVVTWFGVHLGVPERFGPETIEEVPAEFVQQFVRCRAFSKHLGHFYLAFNPAIRDIQSQSSFDALYAETPVAEVEAFVNQANRFRSAARHSRLSQWLAEHKVYDEVTRLIRSATVPVYIVTAKDATSVLQILEHQGIRLDEKYVYGELRSKTDALKEIADRHAGSDVGGVGFLDDNIQNVIGAKSHGFSARWATWGYNVPDHARLAREHGIDGASLSALAAGRVWEAIH